jgi:hypothetical protein
MTSTIICPSTEMSAGPRATATVREADDDQQDAHGLHDGDGAQIAAELRRQRDHLRHGAGTGAEQRGERIPTVHDAQIARGRQHHDDGAQHEQRNAHRPRRHAA